MLGPPTPLPLLNFLDKRLAEMLFVVSHALERMVARKTASKRIQFSSG
jgi:hypothetical protein